MYKTRECSMDAILYQIKKINENPFIKEFVLTGGEPLADINKLQILLDAIEKPVYVNTTFPLTENKDEIIKFLNNSNIAGINTLIEHTIADRELRIVAQILGHSEEIVSFSPDWEAL